MSSDNPCSELYCNSHSVLDYLKMMEVRVSRNDIYNEFSIADEKIVDIALDYLVDLCMVCATYDSQTLTCFFQAVIKESV